MWKLACPVTPLCSSRSRSSLRHHLWRPSQMQLHTNLDSIREFRSEITESRLKRRALLILFRIWPVTSFLTVVPKLHWTISHWFRIIGLTSNLLMKDSLSSHKRLCGTVHVLVTPLKNNSIAIVSRRPSFRRNSWVLNSRGAKKMKAQQEARKALQEARLAHWFQLENTEAVDGMPIPTTSVEISSACPFLTVIHVSRVRLTMQEREIRCPFESIERKIWASACFIIQSNFVLAAP